MVTEREELTFIKRTSDHDSNEKQITICLYFHKVLSFIFAATAIFSYIITNIIMLKITLTFFLNN